VTTISIRQRPMVVGRDARRFVSITWALASTDFKLRFYGSVLGYLWTLVRPFAFFGVIYFVFAEIIKLGAGVKHYPAYILVAMVLYQFFAGVVTGGLSCLVDRANIVLKMRFPRLVIPLAVTLEACFDLSLTLAAVSVFLLLSGVYPTWGWLELIPLVGLLTMFATGLGLLLSVLFVRFRDVKPIWDVVGQMLFYASPVIYVATMVPASWLHPYLLNPVAAILTQMRHAVIDPTAPTTAELIGGADRLILPAAIVVVVCALGLWAFYKEAPRAAENL
jgi:ABC-2 type transport system permease protein